MLESFNCDTEELCATNRYLQAYIDIYHKKSERRAAYTEQSTAHLNKVTNINVNSDSITPQKKNGREEDRQEDHKTPFN